MYICVYRQNSHTHKINLLKIQINNNRVPLSPLHEGQIGGQRGEITGLQYIFTSLRVLPLPPHTSQLGKPSSHTGLLCHLNQMQNPDAAPTPVPQSLGTVTCTVYTTTLPRHSHTHTVYTTTLPGHSHTHSLHHDPHSHLLILL